MIGVTNSLTFPRDLTQGSWVGELERTMLFQLRLEPPLKGGPVIIPRETFEITDPQISASSICALNIDGKIDPQLKTKQEPDADEYLEHCGVTWVIGKPSENYGATWVTAEPSENYGVTLLTAEPSENYGVTWVATDVAFEIKSPFSKIDESRDEDSKIREYIAFIRESLKHPFRPELAERISYLFDIAKEDIEEEEEMSSESLRFLIYFIQSVPNLEYPDVVLTPEGNIVAEWRADRNRHFSVEFREDKYVHFVIFAPNPLDSQRPISLSGIAPLEELEYIIKSHNVDSWALING